VVKLTAQLEVPVVTGERAQLGGRPSALETGRLVNQIVPDGDAPETVAVQVVVVPVVTGEPQLTDVVLDWMLVISRVAGLESPEAPAEEEAVARRVYVPDEREGAVTDQAPPEPEVVVPRGWRAPAETRYRLTVTLAAEVPEIVAVADPVVVTTIPGGLMAGGHATAVIVTGEVPETALPVKVLPQYSSKVAALLAAPELAMLP